MRKKSFTIILFLLLFVSLASLTACGKTSCDVIFYSDGNVYDTVIGRFNSNFELPETPKKDGYTFEGWYSDENVWQDELKTNIFMNNKPKNNVFAYAKWSCNVYNIYFEELQEDDINPNDITTYTVETETVTFEPPIREGYIGTWNVNSIPKGSFGDIYIFPQWTLDSFDLVVEKNIDAAGSVNTAGGSFEYRTIVVLETASTNLGYEWVGWYDGEVLLTEDSYISFVMPAETETYTAVWEVVPELRDFTFTSTESALTITKYNGSSAEITVPDYATAIAFGVFKDCGNISKLTIPFIGAALNGTANAHLGYIFGINSYTSHGNIPSSLKSLTVTGRTSIGNYALYRCNMLESVELVGDITSIGNYAFNGCSGLFSITIPESVNTAGSYAFAACSRLTIYCKNSLQPSGWDNTWNSSKRPVYWNIHDSGFVENSEAQYILRGGSEGTRATLTRYKGNASSYNVPSVIFAGGAEIPVIAIGGYAFSYCTALTTINIPDGIENIGGGAFSGCGSLQSITLPFIGESRAATEAMSVFGYIFGMESYPNDSSVYQNYESYYIPISLKFLTITDITVINSYSLYNCKYLESIDMPDSLESIAENAFAGCTGLTSIKIPDSVNTIAERAFARCAPQSITLPFIGRSRTAVDGEACFGYIFGTSNYAGSSGTYQYFATYYIPSSLKTVTVTDTEKICRYAFYNCANLTKVIIGASVTEIGERAFYNCFGLTLYCEAETKPDGWHSDWNYSLRPVFWGYSAE